MVLGGALVHCGGGTVLAEAGDSSLAGDTGARPDGFFSLRVQKSGGGIGVVSSKRPGIDCGSTCSAFFPPGTEVVLLAEPGDRSGFERWSRGCNPERYTKYCSVVMDRDRDVEALFLPPTYTINLVRKGNAEGGVSAGPGNLGCLPPPTPRFDCWRFVEGSTAKLLAQGLKGAAVGGFPGDPCNTTARECSFVVDADREVTASFWTASSWDPAWSVPGVSYANGDLEVSGFSAGTKVVRTKLGHDTGRWYWELAVTSGSTASANDGIGIVDALMPNTASRIGDVPKGIAFGYSGAPAFVTNWAGAIIRGSPSSTSALKIGNVYMFALDLSTADGKLWAGHNGVWYNDGNPASGTNPVASGLSGTIHPGVTLSDSSTLAITANFGQRPFAYPLPETFNGGWW